ncbi:NAD-dependent epimerase/dehydratase family protein [Bacillus sp. DTU_2020_1000418_1_SI_GHA_SEK_038]|uniref:NAD-dependent epimerase/dehydratase family protein n=1 Tax=Bacillus sp. DTU_2020_1000418_1_SI_GHA_SEK_038 TaxID=3077585 RepID=UPI0028E72DC7|nr:NAD-dependent epimerase/dehydratase family protein [Bacillus sp. DTU_2020_1000418_1_SI_GHA_SEK_038]WNS76595.1 NAD-dependent epimerase/dehydratase family protein [Bacillus sp. DTU_2020_1000418_1_SI_GHA_SEK_038]
MNRRILVLGGTQFFGKKLVGKLLQNGDKVTVATRGFTPDPFGDQVERLKLDRRNEKSIEKALADRQWDIVYDQTCQSPLEAQYILQALTGKVKRYIFTSTQAVYDFGVNHVEDHFNPYEFTYEFQPREQFIGYKGYQEAKRAAEALLFSQNDIEVAAARFPIVIGKDDFTNRLRFHVDKVINNEEIGLSNPDSRYSFILSDDAAQFLYDLGASSFTGPINPGCKKDISLKELLEKIESQLNLKAKITGVLTKENASPYSFEGSWSINTSKAEELGYSFAELDEVLEDLIEYYSISHAQNA